MRQAASMKQGVQSLETGIGVLEAIVGAQRPLRLMEVAELTALSSSKARMYLISLIRTGMVEQDAETGTYGFGPRAARLGVRALRSDGLLHAAEQLAATLAAESGDPVFLSGWDEDHAVILFASPIGRDLPIAFRVGRSTSLTETATGKTFLAFKEKSTVIAALAARGYPRLGAAALRELETIRKRGFAKSDSIYLQQDVTLSGFGALAAPIFGNDGEVRFVVTVLYRSTGGEAAIAERVEKIRAGSHAISFKKRVSDSLRLEKARPSG